MSKRKTADVYPGREHRNPFLSKPTEACPYWKACFYDRDGVWRQCWTGTQNEDEAQKILDRWVENSRLGQTTGLGIVIHRLNRNGGLLRSSVPRSFCKSGIYIAATTAIVNSALCWAVKIGVGCGKRGIRGRMEDQTIGNPSWTFIGWIPGGTDDETKLHDKFTHLCISGYRDTFFLCEEIADWIASEIFVVNWIPEIEKLLRGKLSYEEELSEQRKTYLTTPSLTSLMTSGMIQAAFDIGKASIKKASYKRDDHTQAQKTYCAVNALPAKVPNRRERLRDGRRLENISPAARPRRSPDAAAKARLWVNRTPEQVEADKARMRELGAKQKARRKERRAKQKALEAAKTT